LLISLDYSLSFPRGNAGRGNETGMAGEIGINIANAQGSAASDTMGNGHEEREPGA
jgi:hypothetical protein